MILYLARHGEASRPSPQEPSQLTPKGEAGIFRTAQILKKKGVTFARIWHSPKARAAQTAQIYLEVLGAPGCLPEEEKGLVPDGDPEELLRQVERENPDSLLLVSHLPFLEKLAFLILKDSPQKPALSFPTGSAVCFKREPGKAWEYGKG